MFRLILKNSLRKNPTISRHTRCNFHNGPGSMQQAGFGKVLVILTPIAAGAGVVAYAKYDDKFRQTLVQNVPGIDPVLKVLLREEGNAFDEASKSIDRAAKKVTGYTDTVTGYFGKSKDDKPKTEQVSLPFTSTPKPTPPSVSKSDASLSAPPPPPIEKAPSSQSARATASAPVSASPKQQAPSRTEATPSAPVILSSPSPLPKTVSELEQSLEVAAKTAVQEYEKAINVLKSYNEEIRQTLERSVDNLDGTIWNSLKNKTSAKDTAVEAAEFAAQLAKANIEKLEKCISTIKDAAPEQIENLQTKIHKIAANLNAAKDTLYTAKDSAQMSEKYWKHIESARNYFVNQMEAIFPGINLSEKKLNLSKDDLDLFITYAYSHVLAYQKELQKLQLEGETRLHRAIEALRGDDQTEAVQAQLEFYLDKEKQQLSLENQKKLFQLQAEKEKKIREQMKLQSEAHSDHLSDALIQKEQELRRIFNRELSEKLSNEQNAYKAQLAAMLGKLKGMDAALKEIDEELKARADSERQVHQAQSLWSACQALWASVRTGEPGVSWQERLRPLDGEVAAVSRAGEGDELVVIVLKGVTDEARKRGVYPEDALRERYFKVDKLARRLAMVPEHGARLPIYLLSYLQSMFIISPSEPISQAELKNEPFDFSQLDTFDILNRAKYWMERGNLVQAVKYMNLLQGAPRKIARDWLKEARLLLETQQATNTLMAHAASSGLSFL